jgi:DNA-binding protein HU-beta
MKMNKAELIDSVHGYVKGELPKSTIETVLDGLTSSIGDELAKGGEVFLVGFGRFDVADRAARKGRNPSTGEAVTIAARRVPVFKPGKGLKDKVA